MADLTAGTGTLFTDPDPETARRFFRAKKGALVDKVTSVSDAVVSFVHDGDYVASGGFGTNRISTAVLHEILRQGRKDLGFAGFTATHAFQILAAGNRGGRRLLARVDASYIVGLEARGLSPHSRRVVESGAVEVCEWSNYALAARFKAAAMGIPFLPARSMQGTDTFLKSAARTVQCPFTGRPLAALPALYPDAAFIHVHESDCYGNCRINGITSADLDLARAAKRLIITTERLVSNREIRSAPNRTVIPSFCVDAVCEVPGGSYPGNMGGEYFSDEEHLAAWLEAEKTEESLEAFLNRYVYGVRTFEEYLALCGGTVRLRELRQKELFSREEAANG
ncbi:MAG TPA: CoA-transferase [bacterium]|nr:CoA-transferase [bacterium]